MIAIVDYGVGNLASIKNMLKKAGFESVLASDKPSIENASRLILPGIGAFDHCMQRFNRSGLRDLIEKRVIGEGLPVLGICVGLQMLMNNSEEGSEPGLGWISGNTIKFKKEKIGDLKIPHMGWTDVKLSKPSELTKDLGDEPRFYFVHSYHVDPDSRADQLLEAEYGYDFTAAISRNNIYGVQFHPEKSHRYGMKILENFSSLP
jgi:glutamine amidotransferase